MEKLTGALRQEFLEQGSPAGLFGIQQATSIENIFDHKSQLFFYRCTFGLNENEGGIWLKTYLVQKMLAKLKTFDNTTN